MMANTEAVYCSVSRALIFEALLDAIHTAWHRRRDRIAARLAFSRLAHLDARLLDDIGVTPDEVSAAMRLPISESAAVAVRDMAARRRRDEAECRLRRLSGQ